MTAKQKHEQIGAYVDARDSLWDVYDFELAESAAMAEDAVPGVSAPTSTVDFLRKYTLAPL